MKNSTHGKTTQFSFKHLAERVEAASWQLKTQWKPTLSALRAEHEEALLHSARKLKTRLNRAALQWIATDTFPKLDPIETFFLQMRFIGAWQLLYQLELENGSTMFRAAAASETEFLAWILTKWGHDVGTIEGFDRVATQWDAERRNGN